MKTKNVIHQHANNIDQCENQANIVEKPDLLFRYYIFTNCVPQSRLIRTESCKLIIGINKDESAGVRGIKKQTRSGIHTRPETRCTNKIYQKIEWTHDIQISSFTSRGANVFSSLAAGLSPAAEGGRDLRRGQRQGHVHLALVAGLCWV